MPAAHRRLPAAAEHDWTRLSGFRQRLPQAALVLGYPFARVAGLLRLHAAGLLCETPSETRADGQPCGQCASCQWVADDQHPDLLTLMPEALREGILGTAPDESPAAAPEQDDGDKPGGSREIRIEQVRALAALAERSSHRGGPRIVLLGPVEALNTPAANALLKTLEEPQPGLHFLLGAERLQGIPLTLLSRCRRVKLLPEGSATEPEQDREHETRTALQPLFARMAKPPLDGLALAEEASKLVGSAKSPLRMVELIDGLQRWATATLEASLRGHASDGTRHPAGALTPQAQQRLAGLLVDLQQARRSAEHPLNPRLVLDSLFTQLAKAMKT